MMKWIALAAACMLLSACLYITDNGISFFKPYYMARDRQVSQEDLRILERTQQIFNEETDWNRQDDRFCFCDEKWSLFCALARASIDVTGKYWHRRVAIQEVRFTINDNFKERWKIHQLMDFNNHPATSLQDIRWVLEDTRQRLAVRYQAQ